MRVKFQSVIDGPGPCERVVAIATSRGRKEELVVHDSVVEGDTIEVGQVAKRDDEILIELPQETASGNWRLWVPSSSVE